MSRPRTSTPRMASFTSSTHAGALFLREKQAVALKAAPDTRRFPGIVSPLALILVVILVLSLLGGGYGFPSGKPVWHPHEPGDCVKEKSGWPRLPICSPTGDSGGSSRPGTRKSPMSRSAACARRPRRASRASLKNLSPLEFLGRPADLMPPPRRHRHRYHGVCAPNHSLRRAVTALAIGNASNASAPAARRPTGTDSCRPMTIGMRSNERPTTCRPSSSTPGDAVDPEALRT